MPYLTLDASPPTTTEVKTACALNGAGSKDSRIHRATSDCRINGSKFSDTSTSTNTYPLVELDTDKITDAIAGRLAASLLAHVLFLKNQVPLPIVQLGRLSSTRTTSRAFKLRHELLNSYDTISSHLETTFSALSTALARNSDHVEGKLNQVYLGFLIGSSIATSKVRVILGIDGLEARIWGSRPDIRSPTYRKNGRIIEGDDDCPAEDDDEGADVPEVSEDTEGEDDYDDDAEPSASEDDDEESSEDDHTSSVASPYKSRVQELNFLQNADRLLCRTLANADANGKGINSEMAPTQTHIVLRAPRRFIHPAWIPRQNISVALDVVLSDFLRASGLDHPRRPTEKMRKDANVEGVWIATRMGLQNHSFSRTTTNYEDGLEEDEMIWWSWDGKLIGFADW